MEFYKKITDKVFEEELGDQKDIIYSDHFKTITTGDHLVAKDVFCNRRFYLSMHDRMSWSIKVAEEETLGVGIIWGGYNINQEHAYEKLGCVFCK